MKRKQLGTIWDIFTEIQVTQNKQLTAAHMGKVQYKKDTKNEG